MSVIRIKLKTIIFPLLVLSFAGMMVTFLQPVFNGVTRWLFLALAFLYVIARVNPGRIFSSWFGVFTFMYITWCVLTTMWSDVPSLTIMKACSFVIVVITCLGAARLWVRQNSLLDTLTYLMPLTVVVIVSGLLGHFDTGSMLKSANTVMYRGLAGGSNAFGSLLAMSFPFLLWQLYRNWRHSTKRLFWLFILLLVAYYLYIAYSRSAILVVLFSCMGMFLVLVKRHSKFLIIAFMAVLMVVAGDAMHQYLLKNASDDQGLFYTRLEVWEESYQMAKAGGWMGAGFGVHIGHSNFSGGFSAVGYGREKGNSQLAILEEIGKLGFIVYILLLIALFSKLIKSIRGSPDRNYKTMLGIMTGTLAGLIAMSVFEGWWVAPGGPETVYFWTLAGLAIEMAKDPRYRRHDIPRRIR